MIEPDLTGRTALVTGSAKGVGRELLLSLADCGADVAVHYRSSGEAAEAVAAEARDRGVDATTARADVTDEADVDALFSAVQADPNVHRVIVIGEGGDLTFQVSVQDRGRGKPRATVLNAVDLQNRPLPVTQDFKVRFRN